MVASTERLMERTFAGYRLLRVLGRGGMGVVFLGRSLADPSAELAIKVLIPSAHALPETLISFRALFLREVQAMNQLRHRHIVPVLGYGEYDEFLYIIMPHFSGGSLAERLKRQRGVLSLEEAARYLKQLAGALDYAHRRGVVHRDIKPGNVMLDAAGDVYLTDFGIARLMESGSGMGELDTAATTLTVAGEVRGTPPYMAPELFRGEQAGPEADIYSLGIMLYSFVTGHLPFQGQGPLDVGIKHLSVVPPAPHLYRARLPEPAESAILCALAKFPEQRFKSAGALARAFEQGLQEVWTTELRTLRPSPGQGGAQKSPSRQQKAAQMRSVARMPRQRGGRLQFVAFVAAVLLLLSIAAGMLISRPDFISSTLSALNANPQRNRVGPSGSGSLFPASPPTPTLAPTLPSKHGGSHSTTYSTGAVTVMVAGSEVYAVNDSQEALWRYQTASQVISPFKVAGLFVYFVTYDGEVYALRISDGTLLWFYDIDQAANSPLKITHGLIYVYAFNGTLYKLRVSDGTLLAIIPAVHTPAPTAGTTPAPHATPTPTPTMTSGPTPTADPTPAVSPTPAQQTTPTPVPTSPTPTQPTPTVPPASTVVPTAPPAPTPAANEPPTPNSGAATPANSH